MKTWYTGKNKEHMEANEVIMDNNVSSFNQTSKTLSPESFHEEHKTM